jgi:hypothetical protein
MDILVKQSFDLVVVKDVASEDWFSASAVLLAARAAGLRMPFVVVAEPYDQWTKHAVEVAGPAALVDDRSSRWLVPLLVQDWLEGARSAQPATHPSVAV